MNIEDSEILEGLINGNSSAFRKCFEKYYDDLCNFVNLYVRDEATSEDIVQDIFFYLWKNRSSISINSSFKHYLFYSAKNKSLNHLRNQRSHASKEQDTIYVEDFVSDSTNQDIAAAELSNLLNAAISKLPPKCKEVYLLSRDENLTNKEISERLGISVKTVENQMTIALRKLKETLQDYNNMLVGILMLIIAS